MSFVKEKFTFVFKASFALKEYPEKGVAFISCGDYQVQDIDSWRMAMIARYGEQSVTELKQDVEGKWMFEYSDEVDKELIIKDMGITFSGPSSSSTSFIIEVGDSIQEPCHRVGKKYSCDKPRRFELLCGHYWELPKEDQSDSHRKIINNEEFDEIMAKMHKEVSERPWDFV